MIDGDKRVKLLIMYFYMINNSKMRPIVPLTTISKKYMIIINYGFFLLDFLYS